MVRCMCADHCLKLKKQIELSVSNMLPRNRFGAALWSGDFQATSQWSRNIGHLTLESVKASQCMERIMDATRAADGWVPMEIWKAVYAPFWDMMSTTFTSTGTAWTKIDTGIF